MVKLCPHHQSTIYGNHATYSKSAKRYYEPYQILERIGKATYKIKLPEGARVHPVFYFPCLSHFIFLPQTPPLPCHYRLL